MQPQPMYSLGVCQDLRGKGLCLLMAGVSEYLLLFLIAYNFLYSNHFVMDKGRLRLYIRDLLVCLPRSLNPKLTKLAVALCLKGHKNHIKKRFLKLSHIILVIINK